MELLKTIRRRSFISESVYVALNIGLAVAVLVIVRTVASPFSALLLVLLSKWRVFAVRPRYWAANIQSNLVDVVVSVSVVMLMYDAGGPESGLWLQIFLAILYVLWLVVLKPKSTKRAVVAQAGVALLVGVTMLFVSLHSRQIEILVISMAIIGYVTARHALTQFEEDHLQFFSFIWAFIMAQLAWVLSHWAVAYQIPLFGVRVPQATLIVGMVTFSVYSVYASHRRHGKVRSADVAMPIMFSASIVFVLMVFFNSVPIGVL